MLSTPLLAWVTSYYYLSLHIVLGRFSPHPLQSPSHLFSEVNLKSGKIFANALCHFSGFFRKKNYLLPGEVTSRFSRGTKGQWDTERRSDSRLHCPMAIQCGPHG